MDLCIDMCLNMYIDMCTDMCPDMSIDTCLEMCIDMSMDTSIDLCIDVCIDMCIDMCMDLCIHMRIDMCIDMWCIDMCTHMCIDMCVDILGSRLDSDTKGISLLQHRCNLHLITLSLIYSLKALRQPILNNPIAQISIGTPRKPMFNLKVPL